MIPYNDRHTLVLKQLCKGALDECTTAMTSSAFESHLSWLGHRDDSLWGDDSGHKDDSRVSSLETQRPGRAVRVWAERCPAWLSASPVRKPCPGLLWQLRLSKSAVELLAGCRPVCPSLTLLSGQVTIASSLGNWQVFQTYQDCRRWPLWWPWGWGQMSSPEGESVWKNWSLDPWVPATMGTLNQIISGHISVPLAIPEIFRGKGLFKRLR